MSGLRSRLPWWAKIPAKIALASLPIPYGFWKRLGLFDHGAMDDGEYALRVFRKHFERARPLAGFSCLELGPGDSAATALVARAHGGRRTWLVDTGAYAATDPDLYRRMLTRLRSNGSGEVKPFGTFEELLQVTDASYLTHGVGSLRSIPDGSVDFAFSQAALEHVRRSELDAVLRELRRVLHPGGRTTHQIDLQDHIAESLHSLRFSERVWESGLIARSGLYTNRVRADEMRARFERAGFELVEVDEQRWESMPIPRGVLAEPFRSLPERDLLVRGLFVVARPA